MQCSWCSAEQEAMDFLFQGGKSWIWPQMNWTYGKRTKPALTICSLFCPEREDVVKALYPILLHPEMIFCPRNQLFNPAATNCAQLFTASSLRCFPEIPHCPVPGLAAHRQSLHDATCQTVAHICIFQSKCMVLHWTYFWLGKAAELKTQNSSKSLKIQAVLQNQSIHS